MKVSFGFTNIELVRNKLVTLLVIRDEYVVNEERSLLASTTPQLPRSDSESWSISPSASSAGNRFDTKFSVSDNGRSIPTE